MFFPQRKYVFLDLETSNNKPDGEILQIAGIMTDDTFEIQESFDFLIKPKNIQKGDPKILNLIGYSEEKWKDAQDLEKVLKSMWPKWKDATLVGWVSHFDWARLEKAFFDLNLEDPFHYKIDVASMALVVFKEHLKNKILPKLSLTQVCNYLGIERGKEHNAFDDAYAVYKVFLNILNIDIGKTYLKEEIVVYTDGGSLNNPGPSAIGVIIKFGNEIKEYAEEIGVATNNQAEYQAVLFALKKIKQLIGGQRAKESKIVLHLDSELVGKQLMGEYKVEEEELQKLFVEYWNLKKDFGEIEIHLIPREENTLADKLVKSKLVKLKLIP